MKIPGFPLILPLVCLTAAAQTTTVGSGAPTVQIQQSFQRVFFRNGFNNLVTLPPLGNVKTLGTQALVQEFADATNSANKYALVKPNVNQATLPNDADVDQMYPGLYSYYTSLGPTTVGYPTMDTTRCPALVSYPGNTCQYQLFDKPAGLFVYQSPIAGATNFYTIDPFYTKWQGIGGLFTAGPVTSAATAITSPSGIAATLQTFDQAAIFNETSGALSGRLVAVAPDMYATYTKAGSYTGSLGLPLLDEQLQPNGHKVQNFEGGAIDYDPVAGIATVKAPIYSISVSPSAQPLKMNLGDTLTLTASAYDANGNLLPGSALVWSTSNIQVVTIRPSGSTATIKAVGGGSATVTASGGGKSSSPLSILVVAPCCGIGEGAPTPAIQQAFQDAVTRDKLNLQLPASAPVSRLGTGYVQSFQDASTGAAYLLAFPDGAAAAYVLTGAILAKYTALGGPAGPLGYPSSDATAGGRQMFVNQSALAGNPVQLVSASFLTKWASLGYETGAAGVPTSAVSSVLSFQATMGSGQSFAGGLMVAAQSGPLNGQVFFTSGLIASAYAQAGGPGGSLGLPTSDEYPSGPKRHQDFEGGSIDYTPGDAAAQVHAGSRQPQINATPSAVLPGTKVRLAVGGFDPGAAIRVSVAGQPDFTVTTTSGAYAWDAAVPVNAKTGSVALKAVDTSTAASATGSYTIQSAAQIGLKVSKTAGDGQTGLPGALLPQALAILITDSSGNPIVGAPVQFAASPGAQIVFLTATTDSTGTARAMVRLPASDGLALISAGSGSQIVTFSAQAAHSTLPGFPSLSQSDPRWASTALGSGPGTIMQNGALLTAAAAILRYYQNSGALPMPNGLADPATLNQFLKGFCVASSQGGQICDGFLTTSSQQQIPNLWRLAAFVGGNLNVSIQSADLNTVHDLLAQAAPLLLGLSLNGQQSHYVVATGVDASGGITIMDPAAVNTSLSGYASAMLVDVVRLIPSAPASTGFLTTGAAGFTVTSPAGACSSVLDNALSYQMTFCDGSQGLYQLDSSGNGPASLILTDLATPGSRADLSGSGAASFMIFRANGNWTAAPEVLNFTSAGAVNAASFTPALAPGGLVTIFGSGLAKSAVDSTVQIGGENAAVVAQSPFQLTAVLPADLPGGAYPLTVSSAYGSSTQPVMVSDVAPAIFSIAAGQGAILNQDGSVNGPNNPALRGQAIVIYCTGLGAVSTRGSLFVATTPVTAQVSGLQLKPAFAGLAPGFPGLYQVNLIIPAGAPPGLQQPLVLQQGILPSNTVDVAIQ